MVPDETFDNLNLNKNWSLALYLIKDRQTTSPHTSSLKGKMNMVGNVLYDFDTLHPQQKANLVIGR